MNITDSNNEINETSLKNYTLEKEIMFEKKCMSKERAKEFFPDEIPLTREQCLHIGQIAYKHVMRAIKAVEENTLGLDIRCNWDEFMHVGDYSFSYHELKQGPDIDWVFEDKGIGNDKK